MSKTNLTLLPAARISADLSPEVRVYTKFDCNLDMNVIKNGEIARHICYGAIPADKTIIIKSVNLSGITGEVSLVFNFLGTSGKLIETKEYKYEIIDSGCTSTTLIDGCWVSIYHWSEEEARWFNKNLAKLTDLDWKDQIYALNKAKINSIIVENVFYCNEYAGKHNITPDNYKGLAFYPSQIYKERFPLSSEDPLEAILSAADECGMHVFLGVGNFAWFDFSISSLEWHRMITKELFELYGHHPSLYAWYIPEEIFGTLYYDWEFVEDCRYKDIVRFFKEYKAFIGQLSPTKPVALAPSNIDFQEYEDQWKEILVNIDILLPFGFARDPENTNIDKIIKICNAAGTHLWVDMEMFAWPLDHGLVLKKCQDLIRDKNERQD